MKNNEPHGIPHFPLAQSRRDFLFQAGGGFGSIALSWLLARDGYAGEAKATANPLAAKKPHLKPQAKSVIFLFMVGGPSGIDLFDPKPELLEHHGKPLPESFGRPVSQFTKGDTPLLASTRTFKKHGRSGTEVSDLLPHLATCVDDIAVLRVPGLQGRSLTLAAEPRDGTAAAILGYPEDGSFDAEPGRIGRTLDVATQDAYGHGPVLRSVTQLLGRVRPGNSGGPMVAADGEVMGTVFAAVTGSPSGGGFAVPNALVRDQLTLAESRGSAVGTGACAG